MESGDWEDGDDDDDDDDGEGDGPMSIQDGSAYT
jgi:hypothetical protein